MVDDGGQGIEDGCWETTCKCGGVEMQKGFICAHIISLKSDDSLNDIEGNNFKMEEISSFLKLYLIWIVKRCSVKNHPYVASFPLSLFFGSVWRPPYPSLRHPGDGWGRYFVILYQKLILISGNDLLKESNWPCKLLCSFTEADADHQVGIIGY